MTPFILYGLKVLLCSSLLMGYYYLALRNKAFHQWNRFYLLITVALSLTLPLLQFTLFHAPAEESAAIQLLQTINAGDEYIVEVASNSERAIDWNGYATAGYLLVSTVFFLLLFRGLVRLAHIIRNHPVQQVENIQFINTDVSGTPFSFLRFIFWNRSIDIESQRGKQILKHELVHVREWHTADKLFLQMVLIFAWCNPVFWIIRNELKMIHEFIADKKAVEDRDASELAAMILQAAYPKQFNHLINPFFQQSIKRRLRMLTQIQNPRANYLSRILMLPLVAFVVFAFSVKTQGQETIKPLPQKLVVAIDAGHGKKNGQYDGAHSGGIYEDEITLAIARQVHALNTDKNLEIVLIRADETNIDLRKRVELIKAAKADLLIMLHVNAAVTNTPSVSGKDNGFEIYLSGKNTTYAQPSNHLASSITQSLEGLALGKPTLAQRSKGVWVLDEAPCPAVLLECGYLTNAADRDFIRQEKNQKEIAKRILAAISAYANAAGKITVTEVALEKLVEEPVDTGNAIKDDDLANIKAIDVKDKIITVTYKDGSQKTLSKEEAQQKGLVGNAKLAKVTIDKTNMEGNVISGSIKLAEGEKQPLIVLDGKIMSRNALESFGPETIASINVLKGESAIAKYGEAGKDGALIITTKRATRNDSTIVVKGYGTRKPAEQVSSTVQEVVVTGYPTNRVEPVFVRMDVEPQFPADNGGWSKFLSTHLNANVPAKSGAPSGMYKVVVQLLVEKDGSLSEIKPLTKVGWGMEEEVVRVLKLSPKWIPAKQNGHIVRAYRKLPVTFVIDGGEVTQGR